MRRWLPVCVGALAVMVLVGGTALSVDRLIRPDAGPPPRLLTVPASTLSDAGVTMLPAQPPAHCRLQSALAGRGITISLSSHSDCPVGIAAAEATAGSAVSGPVQEAVLARASAREMPLIGPDRLVWVVVVQPSSTQTQANPLHTCPQIVLPGGGLGPRVTLFRTLSSVVFVDARTGELLTSIPVGISPEWDPLGDRMLLDPQMGPTEASLSASPVC